MSQQAPWARGRYESVATLIAPVADELVARVEDLRPLTGTDVVDLACGTGSVARAAVRRGARVTGVDITPELVDIARAASPDAIDWVVADATDTGLPDSSADVVLSSMGIIFTPATVLDEIARLLRPGGTLGFTAWTRSAHNPFHDPVVEVLGSPPSTTPGPDAWGDAETVRARLADAFHTVEVDPRVHTWRFDSVDTALHFIAHESPVHVDLLSRVDEVQRDRLLTAFEAALTATTDSDGTVAFESPYVVVTALVR
ncbi:class I SAM-dependent methyltransferase [uncultured Williamsia sp.]|uniref:class I SAM-dependent methyltransferase n=1 Tax=uncultured Williamsia sp. TaxID=259311 RepID=UPI00262849B0|nr:class I SAM-dependent methyltransferase [uncultured Williamsia sp.]